MMKDENLFELLAMPNLLVDEKAKLSEVSKNPEVFHP